MKINKYLTTLWTRAPLAWAIIRATESELLSKLKFRNPILEVGCGDGLVTQTILDGKKEFVDVGIDLDPHELALAKKTGVYRSLIQADICATSLPDKSFRTVFANGVLEHIPDLNQALKEIARLLKPGGELITTSPINSYSRLLLYYRLLMKLKLPKLALWYVDRYNHIFAHRHLISLAEWKASLSKVALSLESYQYYNTPRTVALHDLSLPFSLGSKQYKNLTGSLVFLSKIRRLMIVPLVYLLSRYLNTEPPTRTFGSILIRAKKPNE